MTLPDILKRTVERHPDRGFHSLASGTHIEHSISYLELDLKARSVAVGLHDRGISKGDRVLLSFVSELSFLVAFWGCVYAGVLPVPAPGVQELRKERTTARLGRIAVDCRPSIVLSDKGALSLDLPQMALKELAGPAEQFEAPRVHARDLAFLQYTSGSTRKPRGVKVTHHNVVENLTMLQEFVGPPGAETVVHWLPLHHDMGLVRGMLCPLNLGAHCYLMNPMDFVGRPQSWLEALSHFRATVTGAPNFGYRMVTQKGSPDGLDLSALKVCFCSAEPIRARTVTDFLDRFKPCGLAPEAFKPSYGLAEATVAVCGEKRESFYHTEYEGRTLVSCGHPLGRIELLTVDSKGRPTDATGEIWLRGPSVAVGYWNHSSGDDPFTSHLKTGDGPFLRTGDLGFLGSDGSLYITGRKDDLMIVRGQNYHPHDLEATLEEEVPGLRPGCTVVYQLDQKLGVACETRAEDLESLAADTRRVMGEEFGLSVVSFTVLPLGSSFKTASGKLQRALTREAISQKRVAPLFQWIRPRKKQAGPAD